MDKYADLRQYGGSIMAFSSFNSFLQDEKSEVALWGYLTNMRTQWDFLPTKVIYCGLQRWAGGCCRLATIIRGLEGPTRMRI